MFSICFVIAIITSLSRNELLNVGLALIGAAILHNGLGYVSGYWGARLFGLNELDCRTVAIEVGLQNGGMAGSGCQRSEKHGRRAGPGGLRALDEHLRVDPRLPVAPTAGRRFWRSSAHETVTIHLSGTRATGGTDSCRLMGRERFW